MSVQKNGKSYRVRWRENGRQQSRTFARKTDATTFDTAVKQRQAFGPHLMRELDRSGVTLHDFLADGFATYAVTLADDTRRLYQWAIGNHLCDLLDEPLIALDVPRLMAHQQQLLDSGRTPNTVRVAMARLSGILQAAVEHGLIVSNPARGVRRPPMVEQEDVRPLGPVQLEQLLDAFDGRGQVIVALCGHLGLRPQEARKALWSDIDGATLTISRARTKKAAARTRIVALPAATLRILRAWRLASGGRDTDPIIGQLTGSSLASWAERHFKPTSLAVTGREDVTLYTLRHSHASALHYCGWTVPEAARRMGHGPVVHMRIYAHPIEAIGHQRWRDLDDLIAEARAELCPSSANSAEVDR